ncbi:hypothetical protein INR49_020820 [Caranx melampygus]|nr:hypothetical protein INR49_020820 [Caranx melampygus]
METTRCRKSVADVDEEKRRCSRKEEKISNIMTRKLKTVGGARDAAPSGVGLPGEWHAPSGLGTKQTHAIKNKPGNRLNVDGQLRGSDGQVAAGWFSSVRSGPVRSEQPVKMKCVVSGCPNRRLGATRGAFSRPPKRFFSFPEDPARVKVWLAALRETDRRDLAEQHLICEDHFLPEDISSRGVSADAIPLMPPCLDPSTISRWGGDSSEEEEEQWAAAVKLPVVDPPQQSRHRSDRLMTSLKDSGVEKSKEDKTTSESLCQRKETIQTRRDRKPDTLMQVLTQGFLELLLTAPGGELDLRQAATKLDTSRQRVNSIINILSGISLIKKQSVDRVQWTGSCPIRSFLWTNQEKFRKELEDMELEEETLDTLISSCSLQLLELTEDQDNSAYPVTSGVSHGADRQI